MSEEIYYIKGSSSNPKGVRQALLEVCPDAENIDDFAFEMEKCYYYVFNGIIDYAEDDSHIDLLKAVGTELEAKKQEKFVEKIMYQRIFKDELEDVYKEIYGSRMLYHTIEEAMAGQETIGYREIKIMVKE